MTPAERKAVAETLREWAAWCEANPHAPWWHFNATAKSSKAFDFGVPFIDEFGPFRWYMGEEAATGLLLAAAMVEAGDSL
jgi:hypothetical protein